jgi:hypothetical protein
MAVDLVELMVALLVGLGCLTAEQTVAAMVGGMGSQMVKMGRKKALMMAALTVELEVALKAVKMAYTTVALKAVKLGLIEVVMMVDG